MKKDLVGWLLGENKFPFGNWEEVEEPNEQDCNLSAEDGCKGVHSREL